MIVMKRKIIFCFLIIPLLGYSQFAQLGQDIDGESFGDQSGYSVSLNSEGTRVAIGAQLNDANGAEAGHVRIYEFNEGIWSQLGSDIDGEAALDLSGWSVSLDDSGNRVAIGSRFNDGANGFNSGHVRVYEFDGGDWIQLGEDIDGDFVQDQSGQSVSMSADGNRLAVGAYLNDGNGVNSGHVKIYEFDDNSWQQLGEDIDGETFSDQSGWSVSLNADGNRVVIGAYLNDDNGPNAGHVRIYDFDNNSWVQLGEDIDGESAEDLFGYSVSMNASGSRIAVGAYGNDANGSEAGHVRVFEFSNGQWLQLGEDIDGESAVDRSGWSVSLNADGNRVAIGAYLNDGSAVNSGHVRIYELEDNNWSQLGEDIDGEASFDSQSGWSVSLNSQGNRVAIGAYLNDGSAVNSGHVRVFEFEETVLSVTDNQINNLLVYPNPTKDYFSISGNKEEIKAIKIYDINGSLLRNYTKEDDKYRVSDLYEGIYFINIETEEDTKTLKLIRN